MHMHRLPSFLCAKRMGALYGLMLGWIQPCTLGMCLAVYVPQLTLQEISGTVWV